MRRVVVTGLGAITPLGCNLDKVWEALINGRSAIRRITKFNSADCFSQIAGEVRDFEPRRFFHPKELKQMADFIAYGTAAAKIAMEDSGLRISDDNRDRVGVLVASGIGGLPTMERGYSTILTKGSKRVSPFFIPALLPNLAAGKISITLGLRGPNSCVSTACAASAHAIGDAFRLIQSDRADVMISGGAEACICSLAISGFGAMRALSQRNNEPEKASRPFDKERDGFVMAEGAGIIILEELELAKKRGARIYGEIVGYGLNGDASHITQPSFEGTAKCLELALKDAALAPQTIDYINAHGTATPRGDVSETKAIKKVFKEDSRKVTISSTKSVTGHLLGAAGAVEAIFSLLALRHNIIPPTINLEYPDPECDLDYCPNQARSKKLRLAMSTSLGFGGTNACLIFKKV